MCAVNTVIDLDEFVYARPPHATIPHFLATLPKTVELIGLPWKVFGSSGLVKQPTSVIRSFLRREQHRNASHPKGLLETENVEMKSLFRMATMRRGPTVFHGALVDVEHQHRAKVCPVMWC